MVSMSMSRFLIQLNLVFLLSTSFCCILSQVQAECDVPPKIPFSRSSASKTQSVFSEGEQVKYTCDPGFNPMGRSTTTCRDGQWMAVSFECRVIVCGDPGIPANGKRIGTIYQFGSQVRFTCNEGYSLIGRKSSFCQSNQHWSNPLPTCKVAQCPSVPMPVNGRVFPSNRATLGTLVRYTCDRGFKWTGDSERTCLSNGTWSGADGECKAYCGPLKDLSENVLYEGSGMTTAGDIITFRCPTGYSLYGSTMTTCTQNGTWSNPSPTCRVLSCGDPGRPTNGKRTGLKFHFGSLVTFTCLEGFIMKGRRQTFCQADQTWSNPVPYCEVVKCPLIYQPDHGRVFPSGSLTYGTTVRYSCHFGYVWTGTLARICQSDGTWSGEHGTCEVVNCGVPKNLIENHAEYKPKNMTYVGSAIFFSCPWGYTLNGAVSAECGTDGRWSASTPRCMMSCAQTYIKHGQWETERPSASHGQSSKFNCNLDSEDHDPVPENGLVTCDDGVWTPKPMCKYDGGPWWCVFNKGHSRCSEF